MLPGFNTLVTLSLVIGLHHGHHTCFTAQLPVGKLYACSALRLMQAECHQISSHDCFQAPESLTRHHELFLWLSS